MTDSKKPKGIKVLNEIEISTDKPVSESERTRKEAKTLLNAPQLPTEFVDRIQESEMVDAEGNDLKVAALQICDNINAFLRGIDGIPELSESAQAVKEKLRSLTGEPLHEQISAVLEELETMAELLIEKGVDSQRGADYLQNTQDGPGTPRVDMEAAMKLLGKTRPLDREIRALGLAEYVSEREAEMQSRMNESDTQFVARYKIQRNLENQITEALERGEISEETARLVLKASSGQMNMAYNAVAQLGIPLSMRLDEYDLGDNEAEKQFYLLSTYWHLLGVAEGVKYLKRFYG